MSSHKPAADPRLNTTGYEEEVINMKQTFTYTVWFYAMFGIMTVISAGILIVMAPSYFTDKGGQSRMARVPGKDQPLLQSNITSKSDIADMRRHEQEVLDSTGPVNEAKGEYRIPIEDAIKLSAQRGINGGQAWPAGQGRKPGG